MNQQSPQSQPTNIIPQQLVPGQPTTIEPAQQFETKVSSKVRLAEGGAKIRDLVIEIEVPINGVKEWWEFSTSEEDNIHLGNFDEHCTKTPMLLSKWALACEIFRTRLKKKKTEFEFWQVTEKLRIKRGSPIKYTIEGLENEMIAQNAPKWQGFKKEIDDLEENVEIIEQSIIMPLKMKVEMLKQFGYQLKLGTGQIRID